MLDLNWMLQELGKIELKSIAVVAQVTSNSRSRLSSTVAMEAVLHRSHLHEYCAGGQVHLADLVALYSGWTGPMMLGLIVIVESSSQVAGCSLAHHIDTVEGMEKISGVVADLVTFGRQVDPIPYMSSMADPRLGLDLQRDETCLHSS